MRELKSKLTRPSLLKGNTRGGDYRKTFGWGAYRGLGEINNYTHKVINHSKHFVDPEDRTIHTQNIERLWWDIKEWSRRPAVHSKYLHQYLARYLFVTGTEEKIYSIHFLLALLFFILCRERKNTVK